MASASDCGILYLITDELMVPQGEHQDGLASGPQALFGLSAFQEGSQPRWVFGPYARITSRSSLKGNC
jgi:hypothetical protein